MHSANTIIRPTDSLMSYDPTNNPTEHAIEHTIHMSTTHEQRSTV